MSDERELSQTPSAIRKRKKRAEEKAAEGLEPTERRRRTRKPAPDLERLDAAVDEAPPVVETPIPGLEVDDPEAPIENAPGHGRPITPEAAEPPAKRKLRDRIWQPTPKEPKSASGKRRKRESTAELLGMLWGGGGWLAMKAGDAPVGRAMQFQAISAGPILERATQDTPIDLVLQPFARNAEAWKDAAQLLALPVLVAVMERSPEAAVTFEPMLRDVILANAATIVPMLEKRQADEQARAAALERLGIGSVDQILDALFAAPPGDAQAPGPEGPGATGPSAAGNGAGTFDAHAPQV